MTAPAHMESVKRVVKEFDPHGSNRYFLFGSFVRTAKPHDIDLGVIGNAASQKKLSELRDRFYDSNIPYKVDVVDIDSADSEFREHVLNQKRIVWIR